MNPFTDSSWHFVLLIVAGLAGQISEINAQPAVCSSGLWADQWAVEQNDANGAYKVLSDDAGNVYTIGEDESAFPSGLLLVKYDPDGNKLWQRSYIAPGSSQNYARTLEFDNRENIVVTGTSYLSSGLQVSTVSWDKNGNFRWVNAFVRPGVSQTFPTDLATDQKGNSFVTGSTNPTGINSDNDFFTIMIDKNGLLAWEQVFNGAGNDADFASVIRTDKKGDVYVGGFTTSSPFNRDFVLVKYDGNGAIQWVTTYDQGNGAIEDMELDDQSNVYASGIASPDKAIVKFDRNGALQWARLLDNAGGPFHPLALDRNDNVLVTGSLPATNEMITAQYDKNGNLNWSRTWPDPDVLGRDVEADKKQNVYVLGSRLNGDPTQAVVVIYDKNGFELFDDVYSYQNQEIVIRDLDLAKKGDFHFSAWDDFGEKIVTVKYQSCNDNQSFLTGEEIDQKGRPFVASPKNLPDFTEAFARENIMEVFPNPARSEIAIRFNLRQQDRVRVELLNMVGETIRTIYQGQPPAIEWSQIGFAPEKLPNGVYFVRLLTDAGTVLTQKLIVMK